MPLDEQALRAELDNVRQMLQNDGGDLELVSIEGKNVLVRLRGACGCCPHAAMTLRDGVQAHLRQTVDPEIIVERVG